MADSTLHFAAGLALGTCAVLPSVLKAMTAGKPCAPSTGRLLATAYGLALFAIVPNLLRHTGLPAAFCNGWWMDLFLFHHLIDKLKHGGTLIGEILIVLLFGFHYLILLTALALNSFRQNITNPPYPLPNNQH